EVDEGDAGRIQLGDRARISLAAYPGESFSGSVQLIYPALNQDSHTLQARIDLQNPGLKPRPGMLAEAIIGAAPVDALLAPSDAIVDTGERQYVFVARRGGRFEPRVVRVGAAGEGRVQ